ncbi:MAG TPA: hypothetical protein VKR53_20085 [Puia sp.]|nr:hypothetical protein [Puia sp.]
MQRNAIKHSLNSLTASSLLFTSRIVVVTIAPDWKPSADAVNINKSVLADSVFRYRNKSKNRDSILSMVQLFDTLGNLVERQQFSLTTLI